MSTQVYSQRADHELFRHYPLMERQISVGRVTSPYHIYDGKVMFISGTADWSAVRELLYDQHMIPLRTETGKALMALWICDFTEANLGAHQELQISFFVSERLEDGVSDDPMQLLKRMALDPNLKMLCYGLWNNTETVVAYNRELLGLDARLTHGSIRTLPDPMHTQFRFTDAQQDTLLIEGEVGTPRSQGLRESFALMRSLGWSDSMKVARAPYVTVKVVNSLSSLITRHMGAQTYTKSDKQVLRFFDPHVDTIQFGEARYQGLGFVPHLISDSTGVRFVYLEPTPL